MDYSSVEDCKQDVVIAPMTVEAIHRALRARTDVWKMLLSGEAKRWETIENLREAYRKAANDRISASQLSARCHGSADEYEYAFVATKR